MKGEYMKETSSTFNNLFNEAKSSAQYNKYSDACKYIAVKRLITVPIAISQMKKIMRLTIYWWII